MDELYILIPSSSSFCSKTAAYSGPDISFPNRSKPKPVWTH